MGGDYPGPERLADVLLALQKNLPGTVDTIIKEQPRVAKAQADTDIMVSPMYAQSNLDLYKQFGPELNKLGAEIDQQNQRAASQTELGIAQDYGPGLVKVADTLQQGLDPEFYKNKREIGDANSRLLASMDPTKLTGSEVAELESSIARSGGFANPNDTMGVVSNALKFGERGQQKKNNFAQIVQSTASTLPGLRSGINAFEVATRRALTPNSGDARAVTTAQNTGQNAWSTGNNVMNMANQLQAIKAQKSKDVWDKVQQGMEITGSLIQSVGAIAA